MPSATRPSRGRPTGAGPRRSGPQAPRPEPSGSLDVQLSWSACPTPHLHQPVNPVRVVTAASLFDGHDASINIMRRILQSQGAEVIHLGHNRVGRRGRAGRRRGGRRTPSPSAPTRAATSSTSSYLVDRLAERGHGPRPGVRRRRWRDRRRGDRRASPPAGVTHLLARATASASGSPPWSTRSSPSCDGRPDRAAADVDDLLAGAPVGLARSAHGHRARHRCPRPWRPSVRRRGRPARRSRCSASPAPAARASRRSPTSWSCASASTRRTRCGWRCSPSTPPAARPAAPCSATASA